MTFLASDSFLVVPLYSSSRLTFSGCMTSSPLRRPPRPPRPPPGMPARHTARRERVPTRDVEHARLRRTRTAKRVAAEKVLEDVKGVAAEAAAAAAHALLQRILAVLVVNLALLGVRQHLVRRRNLLELPTQGKATASTRQPPGPALACAAARAASARLLRVAALVRVVLDGSLLVRALQLVRRHVAIHCQQLIELGVVALAGGSQCTSTAPRCRAAGAPQALPFAAGRFRAVQQPHLFGGPAGAEHAEGRSEHHHPARCARLPQASGESRRDSAPEWTGPLFRALRGARALRLRGAHALRLSVPCTPA